ncbi:MAG: hypothetical protein ABSE81_07440 [Candidatus Omnitrophota bacterium]|jgi:hypothetical protein
MLKNKRSLTSSTGNRLTILVLSFLFLSSILYAQGEFVYDAKGKRNPFIPLVTPDGRLLKLQQEEQGRGLTLSGIIYDKQGVSYAIVNGIVVGVGDRIGDYRVLKILENKIILMEDSQIVEFELS